MMKKVLTILLCAVMLAGVLYVPAAALPSGNTDEGVFVGEGESISYTIDVPSDGDYRVRAEYFVEEIHGSYIECELLVDGAQSSDTYKLGVTYSADEITRDGAGNEVTPEWILNNVWYNEPLIRETAFYGGDAVISLMSGTHTFELRIKSGSVRLKGIVLEKSTETVSYKQYLDKNSDKKGSPDVEPLTVQAESIYSTSSKVVLPFCDSSSAKVTPVADKLQVMNSIGGSAWSLIGQEATWQVDIKEDGWYSLSIRFRQDYTDGRDTIRSLKIDGETPFKESEAVYFPYKTDWTDLDVGDGKESYRFYLTKGEHTVSLTPAIGQMGEILTSLQELLGELNSVYRKIIMITSSTPDSYRDYRLDEKIPDTLKNLEKQGNALSKLIGRCPKGTNTALLKRTLDQIEDMCKYTDTIAGQLAKFQSNLSSIGTWINDQKVQSLALDEITVYSADKGYEKKSAGFFKTLLHSIKRFVFSFASEYELYETNQSIEVWVTTGRDQMQIIRRLANETFTPETGVYADLRIIASAALLPAVVAGIGPDVALSEPNTTPVNFASRGAIYDLSVFGDVDEISNRFAEAALVPLRYEGGLFALPETLNYNMLFYRTDIFAEYGWSVPETWDDVRNLIFDLSKNNMQFGLVSGFNTYCMMLAQSGGSVYSADGSYCTLDEIEAVEAFEEYTKLYSEYKIPVSFNFANRFRSGEMPIAVTGYTSYNTLEVFAPEIEGLWDIASVPGTRGEDNTVNHASTAEGACAFILKDSKNPEASWEFLKWWTSADVQAKYGNLVEEKLGAAARYAPANIEALSQLPWSTSFYRELSLQLENVIGIPEVPGGYFTPRNFNNAFRAVVYDDVEARESILGYVEIINEEITRKRKEFGLSVKE